MSKQEQKGSSQNKQSQKDSNVVQLPARCKSEGCSKKSEKAEFCAEHFIWFKEGLVTKEGKKPVDFERKLYHFNKRKAA